ncbi:hypothetical protein ES707_20393 [subsurface metagenome]
MNNRKKLDSKSKVMSNQKGPTMDIGDNTAITTEKFDYDSAFQINAGIFFREDQEKLRRARVTILGMFVGGTVATILARTGLADFILIDHTIHKLSDMNRDICCFTDTLGKNKAEVVRDVILKINPRAQVEVCTKRISLDELEKFIDQCDVYFAQADDLAFSSKSLVLAQEKKKFAISFMPSGLTGYVMVFPPNLPHVIDPTDIFGSPKNLSYRELYHFLRNPLNRCGQRWHITDGKWRIDWFNKWRDRKVIETQICPNVWLGASLACLEAVKYLTGRWQQPKAPKMWHLVTAENRIKVDRFRRRSWLFGKFIYWAFSIKCFDFGRRYRKYTTRRLMRELDEMQKQENAGKEVKPPFMWRHLI